jgi:hypothetical protein
VAQSEDNPASRIGGLALLDWLRPPPGFVTDAALGTTYSLDLVACAAALVSLDGAVRDTADFGLAAALRAMNRLKDDVQVVAQRGCIHVPDQAKAAVLPMLDRFVREVGFDIGEQAFHPKVWIVRQRRVRRPEEEPGEDDIRYVLVVGSRNLTLDTSWDMGVGLVGFVRNAREANLQGVGDFVRLACTLGGIDSFASRFANLDAVVWERPTGVRAMRFGFHHGEDRGEFDASILGELSGRARNGVLWISPFLDDSAVNAVARLWGQTQDRRLVAGTAALDDVARRVPWAKLEGLAPRAMTPAPEGPAQRAPQDEKEPDVRANEDDPELLEDARALHAKIVAVWHDARTASVLIGSANLTKRGFCGANVEAWLLLEGRTALADALWAWSERVAFEYYRPNAPLPDETAAEKALDDWHHHIASRSFTLRERGPANAAELEADKPPIPRDAAGMKLRVARLSRRDKTFDFPAGATRAMLAGCEDGERCELLVFTLSVQLQHDTREKSWVQRVQLDPALAHESRDGALLRRVLPPERFLAYVQSLLEPDVADALQDAELDEARRAGHEKTAAAPKEDAVGLEAFLRALAKAPEPAKKITEIDGALEAYARQARQADPELAELRALWGALKEAYGR